MHKGMQCCKDCLYFPCEMIEPSRWDSVQPRAYLKNLQAFACQLDQPLSHSSTHVLLSPETPFKVRGAADAKALGGFVGLGMVKAGLNVPVLGGCQL